MTTDERVSGTSSEKNSAYGCLFCITGREQAVADHIQRSYPGVRTLVARQEKHKTEHGRKSRVQVIALPSYVFFEAPQEMFVTRLFRGSDVIRVLTGDENDWRLQGTDEQFADWLFSYNGLLGFSQACKEGDRIRILSGPLKDLEGHIKRIDKRGRSGQVSLNFSGRNTLVWLGFELLEDLSLNQRGQNK